jgi:nitrogen regulatory protein P-II 1
MRRSSHARAGASLFSNTTKSSSMKKIEAIIKPFKLDEVRSALKGLGVNEITISEVESCGRQNGDAKQFRGKEYTADFCPKIRMEILVADVLSGAVSAAIVEAASTGTSGDGSIFISQVEEAIRIHAREKDRLEACR